MHRSSLVRIFTTDRAIREGRVTRDDLRNAVQERNADEIKRILSEHPSQVRILITGLHNPNQQLAEPWLLAFESAALVLEHEKLLDLLRRLMWMLNEESGNSCPNAALAMGHIAQHKPAEVTAHLPCLETHAEDPSPEMRRIVKSGIIMIRQSALRHGIRLYDEETSPVRRVTTT